MKGDFPEVRRSLMLESRLAAKARVLESALQACMLETVSFVSEVTLELHSEKLGNLVSRSQQAQCGWNH